MTNEPLRKIAAATLVAVIFVVWFLWALPWKFIAIAVSIVILAIATTVIVVQYSPDRRLRNRPLIKVANITIIMIVMFWFLMNL